MGASLPIMFPTGYTGWKGVHYFCNEPVWVDELAGAFPAVPIVLTKIGRSIRASFDACRVVAMRKAKSNKRRGPSVTPYRRDEGGRSSRAISPSADPTTE